ncbi:cysteine dioxygenase type 1-like [Mya arenaria]|uniref:cysteine dioxygenase type 1-like n=1 Tax=Mya arenaria TaxID=6604 RepID=UPI0022E6852A|nr:cysteine dioxygenase type 1-like [Mya arenaria]
MSTDICSDNYRKCSSNSDNCKMENPDTGSSEGEFEMDIESTDVDCGNKECLEKGRCITNDIRVPVTLADLVDGLHKFFSHEKINIDNVKEYMSMYKSKNKEWRKFAKFDQHRYTRNLVDVGNGKFNLMILCWNENQGSSIHSHANSHCFMKVVDGSVNEEMFDWPNESESEHEMSAKGMSTYNRNEVAYICDAMGLHRVSNPSHTDKAVSLHLYSPPFDECKVFDQRTGHESSAKVTFWSKFGHRTPFGRQVDTIDETAENN